MPASVRQPHAVNGMRPVARYDFEHVPADAPLRDLDGWRLNAYSQVDGGDVTVILNHHESWWASPACIHASCEDFHAYLGGRVGNKDNRRAVAFGAFHY